jgi:hypothetical protein
MTRTIRRRNSSHPTRDGNHNPVCKDPANCNECKTCPRCKKRFLNPWQECNDCIIKYYPET